mmetsp:Transcript_21987/g.33581  ORF Transcript_21987/g.33581 Transcript_21987/m.33581 type:complete len:205 (+) Transcript_21987:342-956(+)
MMIIRYHSDVFHAVKIFVVHVKEAMIAQSAKRRSAVAASSPTWKTAVRVPNSGMYTARDAREHVMNIASSAGFHSANTMVISAMSVTLLRVVSMTFVLTLVHSVIKDFVPAVMGMAILCGVVNRVKNIRAMLLEAKITDAQSWCSTDMFLTGLCVRNVTIPVWRRLEILSAMSVANSVTLIMSFALKLAPTVMSHCVLSAKGMS